MSLPVISSAKSPLNGLHARLLLDEDFFSCRLAPNRYVYG
jgi:hypothetical protein